MKAHGVGNNHSRRASVIELVRATRQPDPEKIVDRFRIGSPAANASAWLLSWRSPTKNPMRAKSCALSWTSERDFAHRRRGETVALVG